VLCRKQTFYFNSKLHFPSSFFLRVLCVFAVRTSFFLLPSSFFLRVLCVFAVRTSFFLLPSSSFLLPSSFGYKIVKKLVCVFLTIALVQGVPMAVQAQQTIDPIDRVVSAGLMNKDASGNFNAEGIISRADLAVILVKTFGLERRKTAQKPDIELPDVPKSYWAYSAIQTAVKTGTMSGYRNGLFFPNQRVTRAEALAIFAQAYGVFQFPEATIAEILAKYSDAGEIPDWARKSIATSLYEGFVNIELATNKIYPLKPMTRGDIAYALSKYLERQVRPTSLPVSDEQPPNRGMGR
jgi:hypothetical protein